MNILRELGQLGLYDFFLLVAVLSMVAMVYLAYWSGYCWVWHYVWARGPEWLVRPHPLSFLAVNITGVIITLLILNKAG